MAVKDPSASTDVTMKFSAADLAGKTSGLLLDAAAMADMTAALKAGFGFDTSLTYGAGTYEVNSTDSTGPTKVSGKLDGGSFGMALARA